MDISRQRGVTGHLNRIGAIAVTACAVALLVALAIVAMIALDLAMAVLNVLIGAR